MNNRVTPDNITQLEDFEVFVFGSNLEGIHGKGAAKTATQWGARRGIGVGMAGNTYGIPTRTVDRLARGRNRNRAVFKSLSLGEIALYINRFIAEAAAKPDKTFLVTQIGCGNAGFTLEQIAPLFKDAVQLPNIHLPKSFWDILLETVILYSGPATKEDFDEFVNNVE